MAWNIQYENDDRPTIQVLGDREKAESIAKKRNKYNERYTITEAAPRDHEIEKEKAVEEALKYGCARPHLGVDEITGRVLAKKSETRLESENSKKP
jgi:hypothetical protein